MKGIVTIMEYKRYGKFRMRDYLSAWVGILVFLWVFLLGVIVNEIDYLLVFPIIGLLIMAGSVYAPNRESFSIVGDTIIARTLTKKREIAIPSEPTLIVSYAGIHPSSAVGKRVSGPNDYYTLRDKYAVTILQKMALEDVLPRLHPKYAIKYDNGTIEQFFDDDCYCYSFVYDQDLLDKILQNRNCLLIIPESLKEKVISREEPENIYIDIGY